MLNKLLINIGLRDPDIHDIIDKIITSNFTKEELNNLYKVGPFFYTIPSTRHVIKLDYRKDFCNAYVIEFQYNSQYCIPSEKDLTKYLPDVRMAIQECKSRLPELVLDYNNRKQLQKEMNQEQSQCIKKLWKMIK